MFWGSPLCACLPTPPPEVFESSTNTTLVQARGYTEEDSAGQSNIFAVEVRRSKCWC